MNKKVLIMIGTIVIIIGGIGVYYLTSNQAPDMRHETINGITIAIPIEAHLTKTSPNTYEDKELRIQLTIFDDAIEDFHNEIVDAEYEISTRNNTKSVVLENLRLGARAYETEDGMTYIIIANRDISQGILIHAGDQSLAIEIANSVTF